MRRLLIISIILCSYLTKAQDSNTIQNLDKDYDKYSNIALQIWDWAEVGYQEEKSAALLQSTLEDAGFTIEKGVAEMPTAFVASYGSGSPVIAILAEYDALPGISQEAIPTQKAKIENGAGHACGHHLFGTASVAAGIEVKKWLAKTKNGGTIRVYGTPAEEGGAGKAYLVREGLFNDVDAVLHWHPSDANRANPGSSLANKSAKFRFYGQPSHAAAAPEKGRSALDGVESMNYMANMLREHVPMETRIHYVITRGGEAPNVVPGFAEVYYYVRHPEMDQVKKIFERVVNASEGAALGTGTRVEHEIIHGIFNLLPNETLSQLMYEKLKIVGGFKYSENEKAFAQQILNSYEGEFNVSSTEQISQYVSNSKPGGSTDVGDVSWMVPTAGMSAATWVPGTSAHSWQAVAAGGTTIGTRGMMIAAKTIALTAIELYTNPEVISKAKEELDDKRGDGFVYESLLGDRKPPLDYRK